MKRLGGVDTIPQNNSASVTLARLQRTFTAQVEALASIRRGGNNRGGIPILAHARLRCRMPGWGVTIDEDKLQRYRFIPGLLS